jgi:hypothetical protein
MSEHERWRASYSFLPLGAGEDEIQARTTEDLERAFELMRECEERPPTFGLLRLPDYWLDREPLTDHTLLDLIAESAAEGEEGQRLRDMLLEPARQPRDLRRKVQEIARIIYNEVMRYPRVSMELAAREWGRMIRKRQKEMRVGGSDLRRALELLNQSWLPLFAPAGLFEPPPPEERWDFPPCPLGSLNRFVSYVREHNLAEYDLGSLGSFCNAAIEWILSYDELEGAGDLDSRLPLLASLEAADTYYNRLAEWDLAVQARQVCVLEQVDIEQVDIQEEFDEHLSGNAMDDLCSYALELLTWGRDLNQALLQGLMQGFVDAERARMGLPWPPRSRLRPSGRASLWESLLKSQLREVWDKLRKRTQDELGAAWCLLHSIYVEQAGIHLANALEGELKRIVERFVEPNTKLGFSQVLEEAIRCFSRVPKLRNLADELRRNQKRLNDVVRTRGAHGGEKPPPREDVYWLEDWLIGNGDSGLLARIVKVQELL